MLESELYSKSNLDQVDQTLIRLGINDGFTKEKNTLIKMCQDFKNEIYLKDAFKALPTAEFLAFAIYSVLDDGQNIETMTNLKVVANNKSDIKVVNSMGVKQDLLKD